MKGSIARSRRWGIIALLLIISFGGCPVEVGAKGKWAVLIVGNQRSRPMVKLEQAVTKGLLVRREAMAISPSDLPIISYHFEKGDERSHCENALGIKATHLLFVGLVEQEDMAVKKVLLRVNNVTSADDACGRIMAQAVKVMGVRPPVATSTPNPTPTRTSTPDVPSSSLGVEVVSAHIEDFDRRRRDRFTVVDKGAYLIVRLRNVAPSRSHEHTIRVSCFDGAGKKYGPTLGGTFTVSPGESLEGKSFPRDCDPNKHNGFLIKGATMGNAPGLYHFALEVDGQPMKVIHFQVGQAVEVVEAYIQDYDRNRRTSFSRDDRSVHVRVRLKNLAPQARHEHTLKVTLYNSSGVKQADPIGGRLVVEEGESLDNKDLPRDIDPNKWNGYLIKGRLIGSNPGTYRYTVELDGQVVKDLYFDIR